MVAVVPAKDLAPYHHEFHTDFLKLLNLDADKDHMVI